MQRLRDRLKQQEAATGRVQEMLESLEKRLEAADTGLSTLVFYHLRALWGDGREIIGLLVQDLAAKQEERERKAWALEGNRKQFQQSPGGRTAVAPGRVAHGRGAPAAGGVRCASRQARQVVASLAAAQGGRAASRAAGGSGCARRRTSSARARVASSSRRQARASFPGISVEARRAINLAAIACAEVLCLRLARTNLVASARAAMARREVARVLRRPRGLRVHHERHRQGAKPAQAARGITQEVAQRTERLRSTAAYLGDFETVPIPESCGVSEGDVLAHGSQGVTSAKLPNVVAEDTWDLFKVLLR